MRQAPDTPEIEEPIDWDQLPHVPAVDIDYPPGFFDRLRKFGVGLPGQRVLDLGTGTGMLARGLARQGCEVAGIDVSEPRIALARRFAQEQALHIDFRCGLVENTGFPGRRFDLVTASNAWWYFEEPKVIGEVKRLLVPKGRLLICGYRWLPDRQECGQLAGRVEVPLAERAGHIVARQTEERLRECDIEPDEPDDDGDIPPLPQSTRNQFAVTGRFLFDENLRLTRDQWRWQILSRPDVSCGLSPQEQTELDRWLCSPPVQQGDTFHVTYRMYAVLLDSVSEVSDDR